MTYSEIVIQASKELNLPAEIVDQIYKSFWKYIKVTIQIPNLKEDISQEEFEKLRLNFNIPSLGKLNCTYSRIQGIKERYKHIKNIINQDDKD